MATETFYILIGGPGVFDPRDRIHDNTWSSYIVPIQVDLMNRRIKLRANEQVHWIVYGPAYEDRWADDIKANPSTDPNPGRSLANERKGDVDGIRDKKAGSYLGRIKQIAAGLKVGLTVIDHKAKFWSTLQSAKDSSITRVWYIGHAAGTGLFLTLGHDAHGNAVSGPDKSYIKNSEIAGKGLWKKYVRDKKDLSSFYGCFTERFARTWNGEFSIPKPPPAKQKAALKLWTAKYGTAVPTADHGLSDAAWKAKYHVPTAGAINKIDFGVIDRPSTIKSIMTRLETSETKPPTSWTKHL